VNFKDLKTWQMGMQLTETIYNITKKFPKAEQFGLTSQIQRAAVSIPSNIAEGSARGHTREYVQFLYQARGSLAEVVTQLELATVLGYIDESQKADAYKLADELYKMINATIRTLKNKTEKIH